jgi:hypothetical protein
MRTLTLPEQVQLSISDRSPTLKNWEFPTVESHSIDGFDAMGGTGNMGIWLNLEDGSAVKVTVRPDRKFVNMARRCAQRVEEWDADHGIKSGR